MPTAELLYNPGPKDKLLLAEEFLKNKNFPDVIEKSFPFS